MFFPCADYKPITYPPRAVVEKRQPFFQIANPGTALWESLAALKKLNPNQNRSMMTPIKILLADADPADATEVRWALDKLKVNYALTHVTSGTEAIRSLQKDEAAGKLPFVLLIDIDLPGKNGVELLTEIQQNPAWKKIKCFFLSRGGRRPEQKQVQHLTIAGYISKPFQLSNSLSMDSLNLVIDLVNYKA